MKLKTKLSTLIIFILILVLAKYALFDYPISTGKRAGNLTKFSLKGKVIKTWEGTIDEGSGDKLTSYFSVRDTELAQELYEFEGRKVVLFYEQYYWGWPRDTNYNVVSWKPLNDAAEKIEISDVPKEMSLGSEESSPALNLLSKTLFCSFLGTLINDKELYTKVKDYIKENNLYLYKQYDSCNQ